MLILKQQIVEIQSTNLDYVVLPWEEDREYNAPERVRYDKHIFQSITNKNKGIKPSDNTGKWLLMRVSNVNACIDMHSITKTNNDKLHENIELRFQVSALSTLALSKVLGSDLIIRQYDSSNTLLIQDEVTVSDDRAVETWWDYFFQPLEDKDNVNNKEMSLLVRLMPNSVFIEVKLTPTAAGHAYIGSMVAGNPIYLGDTTYNVDIELQDFSDRKTDKNGITEIINRDVKRIMTIGLELNANKSMGILRDATDALSEPMMIIGDEVGDKFEGLIFYGTLTDYQIKINNGVLVYATASTEELL